MDTKEKLEYNIKLESKNLNDLKEELIDTLRTNGWNWNNIEKVLKFFIKEESIKDFTELKEYISQEKVIEKVIYVPIIIEKQKDYFEYPLKTTCKVEDNTGTYNMNTWTRTFTNSMKDGAYKCL